MLAYIVPSALIQLLLLGGVPLLLYGLYHRIRHQRSWREIAQRAGLSAGDLRYAGYALAAALAVAAALVAASRGAPGFFAREELAVRQFTGAGITLESVLAALVYGGIQTGLTEELVFRGLIGGSLGRRLPLPWANLGQALVFSLLHLPALLVAPELWPMMAAVAAVALFMGWLRLRSGSILGPWMVHAAANVTTALIAAAQSTM